MSALVGTVELGGRMTANTEGGSFARSIAMAKALTEGGAVGVRQSPFGANVDFGCKRSGASVVDALPNLGLDGLLRTQQR